MQKLTGNQALLAGVKVEVVECVVDGLDLAHLDEPDLPAENHTVHRPARQESTGTEPMVCTMLC